MGEAPSVRVCFEDGIVIKRDTAKTAGGERRV